MTIHRFFGTLVEQSTHQRLSALRVEAWDAECQSTDLVAATVTDAQGLFSFALDADYLSDLFQDREPVIVFRVFSMGAVPQRLATRYFQWRPVDELTSGRIEVTSSRIIAGDAPALSVIRGIVQTGDGLPLDGVTVRAFDQVLSASNSTGTQIGADAITDSTGHYQITYGITSSPPPPPASTIGGGAVVGFHAGSLPALLDRPRPTAFVTTTGARLAADVVVRAYGVEGTVIGESPRFCQAPTTLTVDLTTTGDFVGPSELDTLLGSIAPHVGTFDLSTATQDQIDHIACASRADATQVSILVTATVLEASTKVPHDVFYGLLREGLPATRRELLSTSPAALRSALEAAIAKNTLSAPAGTVDNAMTALRGAAVDMAFDPPPAGMTCTIGTLVSSVLPAAQAHELLDAYLSHEGAIEDFWAAVPQTTSIQAPAAADVQFACSLGALTRFHLPLITEIRRLKTSGAIGGLRDLATKTESDWLATISTAQIGAPSDIPGADATEQKANYAKVLRRSMETTFPTATLAADLARVTPNDPAVPFFAQNPSFELGATRVAHYVAQNKLTVNDVTLTRLTQIERMSKVTTRYAEMQVLMGDGLTSARDVVRMGRTGFVAKYAATFGGEAIADEVFDNAQHTSSQALAYHARYSSKLNPPSAYVLPNTSSFGSTAVAGAPDLSLGFAPLGPRFADVTTLFGPQDFCACEECESVHGPAAYLVDLLQFLGKPGNSEVANQPAQTARDVLQKRRPDLWDIDLTCDNTLTALPYIDLVNEILAYAVAGLGQTTAPALPAHIATVGVTADLEALPVTVPGEETTIGAAYLKLSQGVYPWSLPFDLGATEARVYLKHLDVPRDQLMQILKSTSSQTPAVAPTTVDIAAERLGLSQAERVVIDNTRVPATSTQAYWGLPDTTSLSVLDQVPVFLKQSGLTYDELVDLLDTALLMNLGAPKITPPDVCDTSVMQIAWSAQALAVIHRFLRLKRRVGYSTQELDQALSAFPSGPDDTFLVALATVERLRARFGLPVAVVASWFGAMDMHPRQGGTVPSYYEQVFQSKAVAADPSLALGSPGLKTHLGDSLVSHTDAVLAALRMSAADFALLTDSSASAVQLGEPVALLSAAGVPLDKSLFAVHRIVTFARALGLSIRDFVLLYELSGRALTGGASGTPTSTFDPAAAEAFVDMVARARASGLAPADFLYLFGDVTLPAATVVPAIVQTIDPVLDRLYAALVKIRGSATFGPDQDRLIQQTLAAALGLEARTANLLVTSLLTTGQGSTPILDVFQLPALPPNQTDPAALSDVTRAAQQAAYRHIDKAATIVRSLALTSDEIGALLTKSAALPTVLFDLDTLPRAPGSSPTALFAAWQVVADVATMRDSLVGGSAGLVSGLQTLLAPAPSDLVQAGKDIGSVTGWPAEDVTTLLKTPFAPEQGAASGNAPNAAALLIRLRDAFVALKRLGVSAVTALAWINPAAAIDGNAIAQIAKAKHSEAEWTAVAPPLRDTIRQKQRDALVDYLVFNKPYADVNALFGDLLIDVETEPAVLTSRIKHAIGSVQTFVQRALLGYENGTSLSLDASREWEWRKAFRLWEANRLIFLYPENWIVPELRDDKSPLFEAFERDLRKKDITSAVAEDALAAYLEGLDRVARLDVVASFHQQEDGDLGNDAIDVLHVVGRTTLEPRAYFYRTRVDGTRWTPWVPIDLDIDGDHVVMLVVDRRVHLFWPVIKEHSDSAPKSLPKGNSGTTASSHLEIQLAWSEYHNGKWSARRVSNGAPVTLNTVVNPKWLTFVPELSNGIWYIHCLLDAHPWVVVRPAALIQLGHFMLTTCGTGLDAVNLKVSLPDPNEWRTRLARAAHLRAKLLKDDGDSDAVDKDLRAALANTTALVRLLAEISNATKNPAFLTSPALSLRVFQDDKQVPSSETDAFADGTADKNTLSLPLVRQGVRQRVHVLGRTPSRFRVAAPHLLDTTGRDVAELPFFFYADANSTFFAELAVKPSPTLWATPANAFPGISTGSSDRDVRLTSSDSSLVRWSATMPAHSSFPTATAKQPARGYRFSTFYHPHACDFIKEVHRSGAFGLLRWPRDPKAHSIQFEPLNHVFDVYLPNTAVTVSPYPVEDVDFRPDGAYSLYNWEVFFHIPYLVATRLMDNQRFEEAQQWFHTIFDPTSGGKDKVPQRFWKFRPFFDNKDLASIVEELEALAADPNAAISRASSYVDAAMSEQQSRERDELNLQIKAWTKDPFNPHVIARMRPLAYQKAVVMKYIDNLIAWGDQLFRRETLEAINEATQLYILAAQMLGPRPPSIRPTAPVGPQTYQMFLKRNLGAFSDPIVAVEDLVTPPALATSQLAGSAAATPVPHEIDVLAFCVPPNAMLLGLWDTVADRLFKIRNSMNIDGVVRQLPLFEPPIDPALLVRAKALGVDLRSALDDVTPLLPNYRFSFMHMKAMELASGVVALGGALLAALEKKDAEHLARLRSSQEIDLLTAVREVRAQQVRDAEQSLAALERGREVAAARFEFYSTIKSISATEGAALGTSGAAIVLGSVAQGLSSSASAAHGFPTVTFGAAGWAGSPVTVTMAGGEPVGRGLDSAARTTTILTSILHESAGVLYTVAGYERRAAEWDLQKRLAQSEIAQIDKQIVAAQIRIAIAQKELDNHDLQMDHARAVSAFLGDKLTNEDLYDFMAGQLSTVYFQSYKLAYDVSKQAEKALQYERAVEATTFISFGYWDSLRQGLLAGERLQHDLRRLEIAYLDLNKRELEITKHVSLAAIAPDQLVLLRDTGSCSFQLDEALFDLDYPGHYLRRLKSVSLTVPAVNGSYTSVSATLTLHENRYRKSTDVTSGYGPSTATGPTDPQQRFVELARSESVVTSGGQNDGGLFEVNLHDERFLPFEGAGAISRFTLSMPPATNGFDVSTVTDILLHVRYTARLGDAAFADAAKKASLTAPTQKPARQRVISLRAEYADAWTQLVTPPLPSTSTSQSMAFQVDGSAFPFVFGQAAPVVTGLSVVALWKAPIDVAPTWYSNGGALNITLTKDGVSLTNGTPNQVTLAPDPRRAQGASTNFGVATINNTPASATGQWVLTAAAKDIGNLAPGLFTVDANNVNRLDDTLQDILLVVSYTQDVPSWA